MSTGAVAVIEAPEQIRVDLRSNFGSIRQLRRGAESLRGPFVNFTINRTSGQLFTRSDGPRVLIVQGRGTPPDGVDEVLFERSGTDNQWLKPLPATIPQAVPGGLPQIAEIVRASWKDRFFFVEEQSAGAPVPGLRPPQIGALYAVLAHWKVTHEPANVVMPTGTGKTETMLALLAKERFHRLLVIVPTDALRDQLARKFQTWGVLKEFGIVGQSAQYPVVGLLKRTPATEADVAEFFEPCNVVVTTMAIAGRASALVQSALARESSHLFIDEAHHIKAPTWEAFKGHFKDKPVLQFTATPFRNDGKIVDGKPIFTYPLRKAQAEGYFQKIRFKPVVEVFQPSADEAIAVAAIEQLRLDIAAGLDHLLMARTETINRAANVHALYAKAASDLNPLLLHSRLTRAERKQALEQMRNRSARIVVCVDMLGEGFDLPQLKVAAIHDVHKSLAVTLQFIGRFTRTLAQVGEATAVANIASPEVQGSLRSLYAEDSDWNRLLQVLADNTNVREAQRAEFLSEFVSDNSLIPLQNIMPKMSTMIYRTECKDWDLVRLEAFAASAGLYGSLSINQKRKVAVFVVRSVEGVDWGDVRDLSNTLWHLYLLQWDAARNLLFIHTSDTEAKLDNLAEAVAGSTATVIRGEAVFRVFHGFRRIMLMNLGLNHTLSRAVRFTMFVGADIVEALTQAQQQGRFKSNTFGRGYEHGERTTIGCSHRGRIWSYQAASDISSWVDWCHAVASKVLDPSISFDQSILPYLVVLKEVPSRPPRVPVMIEWWETLLRRSEDYVTITFGAVDVPFVDVGLDIVNRTTTGNLTFRVFTDNESREYKVDFFGDKVAYRPTQGDLKINFGRRRSFLLSAYFQDEPPIFYFDDASVLIYNRHGSHSRANDPPYDGTRIENWDWSGVDLTVESQGPGKRQNSIQYRVIQTILASTWEVSYDFVLDDDAANEAADVVAIKVDGDELLVHLFHCKFSMEPPGARVDDLYAVCGQVQRSARWRHDTEKLLQRLLIRDAKRIRAGGPSRFEKGTKDALLVLKNRCRLLRPVFSIFLVQPGLSKAQVSLNQRELLAATESFVVDTSQAKFRVISSA